MNKKKTKILSALLLAAALAVTQIPVSDVEAVGSTSDFQMDGSKLLKYTGTAEVVSIPDDVKEIGEEAFAGNDYLVKVNIDSNVEKVGYRAFADCDNLRTVKIGDSVKELSVAAFVNDKELKNVSIGTGLREIGSGVFAGCSGLSELSLSEDNPYLFYSNGVLYDDEQKILYALMPNYNRGSLTLPKTVETIYAYAFWGNPYIEHVKLNGNLNQVPSYAFSNCMNLKEVEVLLPIRSIEAKAFEDCVNLRKVTLPDSVSNIHDTAFDGCHHVEIIATPGTYGAQFGETLKASEIDRVEYEDVKDSQVISADEIVKDLEDTEIMEDIEGGQTDDQEEEDNSGNLPVSPITVSGGSSSNKVLGESSIVAGRAVVFIDNSQINVSTGSVNSGMIDLGAGNGSDDGLTDGVSEEGNNEGIGDILSDNAQKGKDFPKYTVVGSKIASQAYYQDASLKEYQMEEGITEIGDFAFARSGLTSIVIPEGVEKIGYGAFYHCDDLTSVTIPSSVKEIDANAFTQTPWLTGMQNGSSPFIIVGDGILVAYSGSDSVVNIPADVKYIGAETFKDHMGITAVNIPDSVTVIGEAAFSGCRNLKTVNGGTQLIKVCDRAFQNCPLSRISIPATMEEIGLGAYDCPGGTDTVTFEGEKLPVLIMGDNSGRLSNTESRTYAFDKCKTAIVKGQAGGLNGTVLAEGSFGFHGMITDEAGNQLIDLSNGAARIADSGIMMLISSETMSSDRTETMAEMPGNNGSYVLRISDSDTASERITSAYRELYGGRPPASLLAYDISLYDSTGQIPITRLGKQYITIQIPKPEGIAGDGFHLVMLDSDGQLEAVEYSIVNLEDGDYIQFTTKHFSPFGVYRNSAYNGQGIVSGGQTMISLSGQKDDTPDTGDLIHPKWFLAIGLLAASVALFFYKGKKLPEKKI